MPDARVKHACRPNGVMAIEHIEVLPTPEEVVQAFLSGESAETKQRPEDDDALQDPIDAMVSIASHSRLVFFRSVGCLHLAVLFRATHLSHNGTPSSAHRMMTPGRVALALW